MANGHSAEAIEATVGGDSEDYGLHDPRHPKPNWGSTSSHRQQQDNEERRRQEEEWQKEDQHEVDAVQLEKLSKKQEARMKELTRENPPTTRKDFLNKLVKDHNLIVEEDIFRKDNKWAIIKLSGVEKIQNNLNIRVTFDVEVIEKDFAVIKATAVGQRDSVQSFGSVIRGKHPDGNHVGTYIVEMAEKRAKNRAVLKLCGAYKWGVKSEDEHDDWKQDK